MTAPVAPPAAAPVPPPTAPPHEAAARRPAPPDLPLGWPQAAQLVVVVLLSVAAGLAFAGAYRLGGIVAPVVAAAVVPVGLSVLVRGRGPAAGAGLLVLNLVAFFGVAFLFAGTADFGAVVGGMVSGWRHLLTSTSPVDPTVEVVLFPVELVWVASGVSAALVLRTRASLAPLVPPLAVFLVALLCGGGGDGGRGAWPQVGAFLVAAAVLVLVRRTAADVGLLGGDGVAVAGRRLLGLVPLLVAFVVLAAFLGPRLVPDRTPVDLHEQVDERPDLQTAVNPILFFGGARRSVVSGDGLIYFRVQPSVPVDRYALAVLDAYDGQQWSSVATFRRVPQQLPADPAATVPTSRVTATVEVAELPGPWLPSVSRLTGALGPDLRYDPVTGGLASARRATPGPAGADVGGSAGQRYELAADVPRPDAARLRAARVPPPELAAPFLGLPAGLPPGLADRARQVTTTAGYPYQQAAQLQSYLRGLAQPTAEQESSTHAATILDRAVSDTPTPSTTEQRAAAFAVMARTIGLPSRVVVGFRPNPARPGTVTAADVEVWPEVLFDGLGWVAFPLSADPGEARQEDQSGGAEGSVEQEDPFQEAARMPKGPEAFLPPPPPPTALGTRVLFVAASLLLLVLVGVVTTLVLVGAGRRRRRRRRRQAPTPAAQVEGAWADALDHLALLGHRRTSALTGTEVAAVVQGAVPEGAAPMAALAGLATAASYGPWAVTPAQADEAWQRADAFAQAQGARMSFVQRLRRWFLPHRALAAR